MAKSRSIGSIYAELSLKDKMTAGLKKAQSSLSSFAKSSAKVGFGALATGAGAASVALIAGTKHTLSMTDELADLSAQTGVSISDMMLLQQAYKDGGRSAEMAGKDIGKMQKSLVTAANGGSDPFKSIGLSAQQLLTLNPSEQFQRIGAALMQMQNPAERTAKAMEIFGKGGMGLMTVFEGLPAAEKALGRMPELAERFGAAMGEANDLIGHLPLKSDQFFMGFTAGIIGELLPNLRKIDEFDFTTIGQNLGASLATGMQMLTDGTAWESFSLWGQEAIEGLRIDFENFAAQINAIWDGVTSTFGDGYNYEESVAKYKKAGEQVTIDRINELEAKRNELNAKIAAKYQANLDAAAAIGGRIGGGGTDMEVKPFMPYANVKKSRASDMVNEYQRRGLSLGNSGATPELAEAKKQTSIFEEMRNSLRKMAETPMVATW